MGNKAIDISEITTGLVLAEPVKNMYGQMLLASGTVLAENHIKLFKTWGINSVLINSEEEEPQIEIETNLDFETMAILKKRVRWTPMNDNEAEIYNLAVQMISKQNKS